MKNVFYFNYINTIGGIEQFFAYLAEKYSDWDITVIYRSGDKKQLDRLKKFVRVVRYSGQIIECDKIFFCFNRDIIDDVIAKEKCLVLHGDYKAMVLQGQLSKENIPLDDKIDKYYGVSQVVCDSWKELTGVDCELVYNPIVTSQPKKLLKLVYCGRLTSEKGGELVNALIAKLDSRNIDYLFYVYSNARTISGKNVVYLDTRLDAGDFLNKDNYDYIVVLSKNEGYCYSLIQALSNGLPAIITPCPVFKELGANETNSITLEHNLSNLDSVVDTIVSKEFKFNYTPKKDTWDKLLIPGKSEYKHPKMVTIEAIADYYDVDLEKDIFVSQKYEVPKFRADEIVNRGFARIV